MTRDPGIGRAVQAAGLAVVTGVADPFWLLDLDRENGDLELGLAVLNEAVKLRAEHDRHLADYAAGKTGSLVAKAVTGAISGLLRALAMK